MVRVKLFEGIAYPLLLLQLIVAPCREPGVPWGQPWDLSKHGKEPRDSADDADGSHAFMDTHNCRVFLLLFKHVEVLGET